MSISPHSPQVVISLKSVMLGFGRLFFLTLAAMLALHLSLHAQEKKDPPKQFTNSIGMEFR